MGGCESLRAESPTNKVAVEVASPAVCLLRMDEGVQRGPRIKVASSIGSTSGTNRDSSGWLRRHILANHVLLPPRRIYHTAPYFHLN